MKIQMQTPDLAAAVLSVLILVAGCGGPSAPEETSADTDTDTDTDTVATPIAGENHEHDQDDDTTAYYTCSMHPSVQQDAPGTCPICSMDLTPVTREELETGTLVIDAQRRQRIGVRTAPVAIRPLDVTIRAVGEVVADETREAEISVKYPGWIGRLHVDETGQEVQRGQVLFTLYSPELLSAQEELLAAVASRRRAAGSGAPERADYLVDAARRRLSLWDLSDRQIDRIVSSGEPSKYVPIHSPAAGFVMEKHVVEGASVRPGQTLFRIAALDRVWVRAEVYESDLSLVEVGQRAEVTFPHRPGEGMVGEVTFVSPVIQRQTRTGTIRIELPNPGMALKPEMYADVFLETSRGEALVVPQEAVIYAGPRRIVFVDLGEGRLQPREIEIGIDVGDAYEVLSGLDPGDVVVTSGNFLIAAESRLKSATGAWE